ncbi:hypothetical protein [uncultured Megasphaera sp.]|jgi:hypothetical protein|uniref:hypothetical protein n=1 Tax=uncultured Megasphaera sp. TaxID=165188 RepID=UPI0025F1D9FE|nr:hypothetical protein [uncultured Megasphaera sp.]
MNENSFVKKYNTIDYSILSYLSTYGNTFQEGKGWWVVGSGEWPVGRDRKDSLMFEEVWLFLFQPYIMEEKLKQKDD